MPGPKWPAARCSRRRRGVLRDGARDGAAARRGRSPGRRGGVRARHGASGGGRRGRVDRPGLPACRRWGAGDELEQARAAETAAARGLRVLVGYDLSRPVGAADLVSAVPHPGEIERLTADLMSRRPELAQLQAERRAAELDVRVARADAAGLDLQDRRRRGLGLVALAGHPGAHRLLGVPRGWPCRSSTGAVSRSRELQAGDRAAMAESARLAALRGFEQQF